MTAKDHQEEPENGHSNDLWDTCYWCKHFHRDRWSCDAYPQENSIPRVFRKPPECPGRTHTRRKPGDHRIQFEERKPWKKPEPELTPVPKEPLKHFIDRAWDSWQNHYTYDRWLAYCVIVGVVIILISAAAGGC